MHLVISCLFFKILYSNQVTKDPKMALVKARELWKTLSKDEPENQARPATLEQLIVMLTRESARRVVHLINFTRSTVSKLPHTISVGVHLTTSQCYKILDRLAKVHDNVVVTLLSKASKIHLVLVGFVQLPQNNNIIH